MSARRWFSRLILALALLAPPLATPPVASATVMVPVPLEDMVRDATAIVPASLYRQVRPVPASNSTGSRRAIFHSSPLAARREPGNLVNQMGLDMAGCVQGSRLAP